MSDELQKIAWSSTSGGASGGQPREPVLWEDGLLMRILGHDGATEFDFPTLSLLGDMSGAGSIGADDTGFSVIGGSTVQALLASIDAALDGIGGSVAGAILKDGSVAWEADQSLGGYGLTGIRDLTLLDGSKFFASEEFAWESSDAPTGDFRLKRSDFDQWKLYSDDDEVRLLLAFSDFEFSDADYPTGSNLRLFKRDPDSWVMATEGDTQIIFESSFFTFTDPQKSNSAAKIADDYENNGLTDWFLMSKDEAVQLYANRAYIDDYATGQVYWTSSEDSATHAWMIWDNGTMVSNPKSYFGYVRPIRTGTHSPAYNLGDVGPGGGKIFYVSGTTYLEAAPNDVLTPPGNDPRYTWSSATDWSLLVGGTATAIGTGDENTALIVATVSIGQGVTFDSATGCIFNAGKSSAWDFHIHGATVDDLLSVDTSENLLTLGGTKGYIIPIGTTGQRVDVQGMVRYNTTTGKFEGYTGSAWEAFH